MNVVGGDYGSISLLDEQAKDNLDRDVFRITSISIIEYIF